MKTPVPPGQRERVRGCGQRGKRDADPGNIPPANGRQTWVFRGSATNRTRQFCHYRGRQANRNSTAAERSHFKIKADTDQAVFFRDIPSKS